MLKNFEGARLGIFIFIGTILFVLAIFLLGNKESLFVQTIDIKSIFKDVEGLKSGAPVRLSGMDIGSVTEVALMPDTSGLVEVSMRIENSVRHLIRLDSEASVSSEGLVGKKIIMITPGSVETEMISEGGTVKSIEPVSINQIIAETQSALNYFGEVSENLAGIATKINEGTGTLGKLVNDDRLYESAVGITQSADSSLSTITKRLDEVTDFVLSMGNGVDHIIANVDTIVSDVNGLIKEVDQGKGLLGALIKDEATYDSVKTIIYNLKRTSEFAMEGVHGFSENMEALKHNWLFKEYFEQRGYWDSEEFEQQIDAKMIELDRKTKELEKQIERLEVLDNKVDNAKSGSGEE